MDVRELINLTNSKRKSILEEACQSGAGLPKNWIKDRTNYIEGYNQALDEIRDVLLGTEASGSSPA